MGYWLVDETKFDKDSLLRFMPNGVGDPMTGSVAC